MIRDLIKLVRIAFTPINGGKSEEEIRKERIINRRLKRLFGRRMRLEDDYD